LNRSFLDLIKQTYTFPQTAFEVKDGSLLFNQIPLKEVIDQFGTPLKLTYLPKIGAQIDQAKSFFEQAMRKVDYNNEYKFCYCTKSSHFAFVLDEILSHQSHLEISSAFDTDIVCTLYKDGKLHKDTYIICNGYKTADYFAGIQTMIQLGLTNVIPILDNMDELATYEDFDAINIQIGLRVATNEESSSEFSTSRFGITKASILDFYKNKIHQHPKIKLKMLHFFVYTGMKDSNYYWNEVDEQIKIYTKIKELCPELDSLNIGGGLPIQNSLNFDYDYQSLCDELIARIKNYCNSKNITEPILFSEFGTFTVGESSACIFKILGKKQQTKDEIWYIVDNTLISTLPDMWSQKQKFLMLPINKWEKKSERITLGGLSCDNDDFYTLTSDGDELFLPQISTADSQPLYVGFFHTGAYQETLSGFGGVHHCLLPSPKHVLIDKNEQGEFTYKLFVEEQQADAILKTLGYKKN